MKPVTRRRILDRMILERLGLGRGVEKICAELHVGKPRVRGVREKAVAVGYLDESGSRPGNVPPPPAPLPLFPDPIDRRSERTSDQDQALLERKVWIQERLTARAGNPLLSLKSSRAPEFAELAGRGFTDFSIAMIWLPLREPSARRPSLRRLSISLAKL